MDDALIERAVEAAAKAAYERVAEGSLWPIPPWEEQSRKMHDIWCASRRLNITAALAEVEADIRASALRDAAVDIGMGEAGEWLRAEAKQIEKKCKA